MSFGMFTKGGKTVRYGFDSVADWFDSVIASFPTPWIIGDDTNYGTEIFDARGSKVLSVWMAWGNPSERQRGGMTDAEWSEYCCDSHWESETQWHIANAIVSARNYLQAHLDNGWYGDLEQQQEILRTLVMAYGRWEEPVDLEIACGGPLRRATSSDPDLPESITHHWKNSYALENRLKERNEALEKVKAVRPALAINPEAKEVHARRLAMFRAMSRMVEEKPPQPLDLPNGLRIDAFTLMDKPYLERLVEIAKEEYEKDRGEADHDPQRD